MAAVAAESKEEALMGQEIERRFVVTALPQAVIAGQPCSRIRQGYVAAEPGKELRARDKNGRFFLTQKRGSGLVREEHEIEVEQAVFDMIWPLKEGRRVEKTRYHVADGALTMEIDIYHGDLNGRMSVEVEFADERAAAAYQAPDWAGAEVTEDSRYNNAQLALHGWPEDGPGS